MILQCPACQARYRVADDAIPAAGKPVRCAKCKHGWFEAGATPEIATPPVAPPIDLPVAVPDAPPAIVHEPLSPTHWAWTVLAVAVGLALTAGAFLVQNPALPPLDLTQVPLVGDRLDALVYPPAPPPSPLQLAASAEFRTLRSGARLIVLSGTVANATPRPQPVPAIEALLLDAARTPVLRWRIAAPVRTLPPGRRAGFDSSTFNIPASGTTVTLRFMPPQ